MTTTTLLEKLVETERALQSSNYMAARALLMQAEDCVLQIEREMIHVQAEKIRQASYAPTRALTFVDKIQPSPKHEGRSGNGRWSASPKMFSRMLVAAVRTSLQRLPNPI